ncbi:hypothetical protein IFM89_003716 [Coptis chinensis]|uniref:Glycosyltransferase N-terminal domain-containing protein n=1 Tax=Coptis chinensis TaxID=261450 RepID=A0A835I1D1_9MAGN|nr:hypothetical protein IFM89_003716 [Coptis chinensis]
MISISETKKPHAVCIPYPAQGHINPMLKLAKVLHDRGFHITFVNTVHMHNRLLKSQGPDSLKGLPDFQFKTIPDGLAPSDTDTAQSFPALCESISKNCLVPFWDLITRINDTSLSSCGLPPVSCIISDGVMTFSLRAAEELGIPGILFWTVSACGLMGFLQFPHLLQIGLTPLKDESYLTNGYLDAPINFIPGIQDIRVRDLPTFIRTTDPEDIVFNFILREVQKISTASAILLNTFDELETEVLSAIKSNLPPVYTIGPLPLLVNQVSENLLKSIGCNLWKEETESLEWLDSKKPKSVVYVNFGSIVVMTSEQMVELAWGLANSNHTFLWIFRHDLVLGDPAILPPEFLTETKERGLISRWCPQEHVLKHPSIGVFLTHNGWNSTIESVCGGVPMICCPFVAEQQMNCRYSCIYWRIGVEIDSNVRRNEVECLVKEVMEGEKGIEIKVKAMQWKKKAEEATARGGSSYVNMGKLVKEILVAKDML